MPSFPIVYANTVIRNTASKQSTEMMASAVSRAVQTVKPHVQSIKFPPRSAEPLKPFSGQPVGVSNTVESLLAPSSQPIKTSGKKGPAIESSELPLKYRRKLLTSEEMEYIEKGGQV